MLDLHFDRDRLLYSSLSYKDGYLRIAFVLIRERVRRAACVKVVVTKIRYYSNLCTSTSTAYTYQDSVKVFNIVFYCDKELNSPVLPPIVSGNTNEG